MQMKNNKTYQNAVAFPRKADMAAKIKMLANSLKLYSFWNCLGGYYHRIVF